MFQLKVILQAVILITGATVLVQSTNTTSQLQLLFSRNQGNLNIITLMCRNNGPPEQEAMFYLNGSVLSPEIYPSFRDQDVRPDVVIFQIKRQLEGMYSCTVQDMRSNFHSLISKLIIIRYTSELMHMHTYNCNGIDNGPSTDHKFNALMPI